MDKTIGYIKVYRSLADSFLWSGEKFSRGQAWIDLNVLAFYKDQEIMSEGKKIKVERGCLIKSIKYLAERWGWSRNKVTRFLDLLSEEGWIHYKTYNKGTKIRILNYEEMPGCRTRDGKNDTEYPAQNRRNHTVTRNQKTANKTKTSAKKAEFNIQTDKEIEEAEKWFDQL